MSNQTNPQGESKYAQKCKRGNRMYGPCSSKGVSADDIRKAKAAGPGCVRCRENNRFACPSAREHSAAADTERAIHG